MKVWDFVGPLIDETCSQHIGEEMVVAIPPPLIVERNQEEVAPIQRFQHRLAAGLAGNGITQGTAQPAQDGGLQQEGLDQAGLTLHDLLDEIVDHIAIVASETGNEAGDIVAPLHRQRGQLQCRNPSLGAPLEGSHVRCGQP